MDGPIIKDNSITIPSNQDYLVSVDEFLEGTLRGFGVDESTIADIAISVTEVVNNGIIHGNKSDPNKALTLTIYRDGNNLKFVVLDEGEGFDPSCVDDPLKEENLLKEVGRGIFIIRSLMDSVDFENTPEGVRVTLTKTI